MEYPEGSDGSESTHCRPEGGRVYRAGTETQAHNFQADHTNVMPRVAREKLAGHPAFKEHGTGDYFTTKKIAPEHLELRDGLVWKPLRTIAGHPKAFDGPNLSKAFQELYRKIAG